MYPLNTDYNPDLDDRLKMVTSKTEYRRLQAYGVLLLGSTIYTVVRIVKGLVALKRR